MSVSHTPFLTVSCLPSYKKKILWELKVGPIVTTKAMNLFNWKSSFWNREAKQLAMSISHIWNSWNLDLGLFTVSRNHLKKTHALIKEYLKKNTNQNAFYFEVWREQDKTWKRGFWVSDSLIWSQIRLRNKEPSSYIPIGVSYDHRRRCLQSSAK